jgi:hypothetical protein
MGWMEKRVCCITLNLSCKRSAQYAAHLLECTSIAIGGNRNRSTMTRARQLQRFVRWQANGGPASSPIGARAAPSRGSTTPGAPRRTTGVLRVPRTRRPCCVPEQVVGRLLESVRDGAVKGALRFRERLAAFHPPPRELLIVGDESKHLGARALAERGDRVLQEEPDDADRVECAL